PAHPRAAHDLCVRRHRGRADARPVDGLPAPEGAQGGRAHPRRGRRSSCLLLHRASCPAPPAGARGGALTKSSIDDIQKEDLMTAVRVFDPAMCCSTGICGPSVDAELVRFAADLDWLKTQGISVERFNLSQQPAAFAED